MKLEAVAHALARAANRAAAMHGRPNSFGLKELEVNDGGPDYMVAGAAARRFPEVLMNIAFARFETSPSRVVCLEIPEPLPAEDLA